MCSLLISRELQVEEKEIRLGFARAVVFFWSVVRCAAVGSALAINVFLNIEPLKAQHVACPINLIPTALLQLLVPHRRRLTYETLRHVFILLVSSFRIHQAVSTGSRRWHF